MTDPREPGHPVGPESDDSPNPTAASPEEAGVAAEAHAVHNAQQRATDMLRQLQQMIDQVSAQAGPPMREIAAKAAELAALAAQRAGPLAAKAAEKTQVYGERFAAKSKEKAAELRTKPAAGSGDAVSGEQAGEGSEPDMRAPENAG